MATVGNQTIDTGNTILFQIDSDYGSNILGRAQSLRAEHDFGTTPIYEIGSIMPTENVFLKFGGTLECERLRLRKKSLAGAGLTGLGEDILGTPIFQFTTIDRYTGEVGIVYKGVSAATYTEEYRVNETVQETCRFLYLDSTSTTAGYAPKGQKPAVGKYVQSNMI